MMMMMMLMMRVLIVICLGGTVCREPVRRSSFAAIPAEREDENKIQKAGTKTPSHKSAVA